VELVFEQSGSSSLGLGSLLLLAFSGLSLTRRLQRLYLQVFRLPARPGIRGSIDAVLGLGALLVGIALLYYTRSLARALPFHWVLGMPVSVCAGIAIWTSLPWLLLNRRIPWQRLLPVGVLAGTAATLYSVATTVYMQRLMTSYSQRYGLFGVTVALVGWLLCIAFIVVATAVIGAELDRAPDTWARRLRARLGVGADLIR
jgi:membrane protein